MSGGLAAERSQRVDSGRSSGNHLDVDTVEALAEALLEYKGTVIFTSHDRHFTKKVATCIVEVRDGRVTNFNGRYEARTCSRSTRRLRPASGNLRLNAAKLPPEVAKPIMVATRPARKNERDAA